MVIAFIKKLFHESEIDFFPFRKDIKGYHSSFVKNDVIAALSVAFVAIPQFIAYTLLAGLPWQAGLLSATIGVIIASFWGSGRSVISGPTTGASILISVFIADILAIYFPEVEGAAKESLALSILMQIVLMVGILQILASVFNLSKWLDFVSRPVILGYFAGMTLVLVVNQLYYLCGLTVDPKGGAVIYNVIYFIKNLGGLNLLALSLGALSFIFLMLLNKSSAKIPAALLVLVTMALASILVGTIFKVDVPDLKDMVVNRNFDFGLSFPSPDFRLLQHIFPPVLALSFLIILEVFSSVKAMSILSGEELKTGQEIFGVGIANFFLSFCSCALPVSNSFTRSIVNLKADPKSRLAPLLSGVCVALIVYFLWPLVKRVPIATLAAILLTLATSLFKWDQIKLCFHAGVGDGLAFSLTVISCLFFDLDVAFFIGVGISVAYYIKRTSEPHFVEYAFGPHERLMIVNPHSHLHRRVRIIGIAGDLFFAAVDFFQTTLHPLMKDPYVKIIVLRLYGVRYVDASMCLAIIKLNEYLEKSDRILLLSDVSKEVLKVLDKAEVVDKIGKQNIFVDEETKPHLSTWKAHLYAENL